VSIDSKTLRTASALVPLAVLSCGWTVMLTVSSAGASSQSSSPVPLVLPKTQSIKAPASVSRAGQVAPAVPWGTVARVASTSTTNGIPAAALAAYQRAAQVIDSADTGCNLKWPLIAAIGRVESDHGRFAGNVLSAAGVSTPGIFGIPLTGRNRTQRVLDTDAGQYDHDRQFDRAVGPMQFIPSTWSVVGVDGDGDKNRNPQDIDDAALATAVYLCSGTEDLRTDAGVTSALFRYNHSAAYVNLVKSIAATYASGSYVSVPTNSLSTVSFGKAYDDSVFSLGTRGHQSVRHHATSGSGPAPAQVAQPSTSPTAPTSQPSPQPAETLKQVVTQVPATVTKTLTELQRATEYCQTQLTTAQLNALGGPTACAQAYVSGGVGAVKGLLDSLGLGGLIGGLLPKG
jgi:hypothetical protein